MSNNNSGISRVAATRQAAKMQPPRYVERPAVSVDGGKTAGRIAIISADRLRAARKTLVGRNEPCPCGSGKKYKRCHGGPKLPPRLSGKKRPIGSVLDTVSESEVGDE